MKTSRANTPKVTVKVDGKEVKVDGKEGWTTTTSGSTTTWTMTSTSSQQNIQLSFGESKPQSSFLPSPADQKNIATAAALLISWFLVYGKGQVLVSMAKQSWKNEGAVVFCAKLVACVLPYVGCFGAVVYLWLTAVRKVSTQTDARTLVQAVLAVVLSVWIICFGQTAISYSQSEMTAMGFFVLWGSNTGRAMFMLVIVLSAFFMSMTARSEYKRGSYGKAVVFGAAFALLVGISIYAAVIGSPGESYLTCFTKCLAVSTGAISVPGLLVSLAISGKMAWDQSMTVATVFVAAVSTQIVTTVCLCIKYYPTLTKGDMSELEEPLRLLGQAALLIFGCAGVVSGLILLKRKFVKHSKAN